MVNERDRVRQGQINYLSLRLEGVRVRERSEEIGVHILLHGIISLLMHNLDAERFPG